MRMEKMKIHYHLFSIRMIPLSFKDVSDIAGKKNERK